MTERIATPSTRDATISLQPATTSLSGNYVADIEQAASPNASSTASPPRKPPLSLSSRLRKHLTVEVSASHTDLLLIACCFISGLVDSTIYDAFGTFVSMQTGNTIFLGLGGSTPKTTSKPYGWAKSFVSIVCFCLGCVAFSHMTHFLGGKRRISLVASFGMQSVIIFIAAAVVQGGVVNGSLNVINDDIDWWTVLPIALLSFQSAGQIVGSRSLGLSEVPTVVLTSMLHDISTDRGFFKGWNENVKRNRRVVAFLVLLAGAIAGGFIAEGTKRMQVPLWIAGGIKTAVTAAWMAWPAAKESST